MSTNRARPTIELVVTDLDGTLWEQSGDVHPRTLDAVRRLESGGTPILVATGRRIASTRAPLAAVGLTPPAVVLNGALGLDLRTGERFHQNGFVAGDAVRVLEAFRRWEHDPCVYVDHDEPSVWVSETPATHPLHLASFGDDLGVGSLDDVLDEAASVLAFSLLGIDERVAHGIGAELESVARSHVDRDRQYGGFTITVAPAQQSKWDGVAAFCALRGIDPRSVLAIGDGPNDVELLDAAAIAVVPADAHPEARAVADHVVGRAVDGGWAELVDLLR